MCKHGRLSPGACVHLLFPAQFTLKEWNAVWKMHTKWNTDSMLFKWMQGHLAFIIIVNPFVHFVLCLFPGSIASPCNTKQQRVLSLCNKEITQFEVKKGGETLKKQHTCITPVYSSFAFHINFKCAPAQNQSESLSGSHNRVTIIWNQKPGHDSLWTHSVLEY